MTRTIPPGKTRGKRLSRLGIKTLRAIVAWEQSKTAYGL